MEREPKPRSLFWRRFFLPAWKWFLAGPPWLYGWFAFIRDEFLPSHIRDSLRIEGVLDMIAWYWWVIISLVFLLLVAVATKSRPQVYAGVTSNTKPTPAWVINARISDKLHKCTFCGFSYSLMPSDLGEKNAHFIKNATCPNCGNVDVVSRYYGPPAKS